MKEILSKANQFVIAQETRHIVSLYNERERLDESKCNCPQCTKYRDSLHTSILDEEDRLDFAPQVDHEEEWVFKQAIKKIKGL